MMSEFSIAIFLASALVAEIVGTIAGFGSALLLTPIAAFFFDIKTTIALVSLFHFFGQVVDGFIWRRFIIWRIGILFSVFGVLFSVVGAYLILYIPSRGLEIAFGIFLILYALSALSGREIRLPKSDAAMVIGGGIVGFIAGVLGTAGAFRTAFLSSLHLKKEYFLGTSFAIAFFVDIARVGVYFKTGLLETNLPLWISVFVVAIFGSLLAKKLVSKISASLFHTIVYSVLLLAGIRFLFL
ncbi:MAG: sulfite exporter TauE/SafE family protein [bacterium]|nr:sulfite exporter TauE/SafE family protein [bacterium]